MTSKNENEMPMTLASKLAHIGKEIGAISKSGKNTQQNYNYIEYGVVAGRIRELFDQYHVIIIPAVVDYNVDEITNRSGGRGYHYVLNMNFTISNGDDPTEIMTATWLGESADYGDKGINKAETSAVKYFLMRLFNVSEKGEEEADRVSPEIASTKRMDARADAPQEHEFTADEIKEAQDKLRSATTLEDLKLTFVRIGSIRKLPEIIALKNELKDTLALADVDVATAEAKEKLDAHFKGKE